MIRSKNDESAAVTQDNGFAIARRQFDRIADRLRLDSATRDLLRSPLREHHFAIPIRMDDGTQARVSGTAGSTQRRAWSIQGRHQIPPLRVGG